MVFAQPIDHRPERHQPARRYHTRLAHRAPSLWRSTRATSIVSDEPPRSEPTGAQSPFDMQVITVVEPRGEVAALMPAAISALKSLAPSMWTGTRADVAVSPTARSASRPQGTPPAGMWVCSKQTRPTSGW